MLARSEISRTITYYELRKYPYKVFSVVSAYVSALYQRETLIDR